MPLWAQEVFIKGENQAAAQARLDLEKLTRYKSSLDATHALLVVDRESCSRGFLSRATVAVTMKLISLRGSCCGARPNPSALDPKRWLSGIFSKISLRLIPD